MIPSAAATALVAAALVVAGCGRMPDGCTDFCRAHGGLTAAVRSTYCVCADGTAYDQVSPDDC